MTTRATTAQTTNSSDHTASLGVKSIHIDAPVKTSPHPHYDGIRNPQHPYFARQRMPGESQKAYSAFRLWLDLGNTRSLPAVAQKLSKSLTLVKRWSSKHSWRERLRLVEAEEAGIHRQAEMEAAKIGAEQRYNRLAAMQGEAYEQYAQLKRLVNAILSRPLEKTDILPNGTTVVSPANWRLTDVVRLGQLMLLIGRAACEMPVSRSELSSIARHQCR